MEELKRMLNAIHKGNKDILTLLCLEDDDKTKERIVEIKNEMNKKYDFLFYGKELNKLDNE